MKVFISWSGRKSRAVAEALNGWMPLVLQSITPWFSPNDISSGAPWFSKIQEGLKDAKAGIICLTAENKDSPWILFESGAIARGVGEASLKTFLIDLKIEDVQGPLAQFNHTLCTRVSVFKLMSDLNNDSVKKLDEAQLTTIFDAMWPKLEEKILEAQKIPTVEIAPRPTDDMLAEVLEATRQMSLRFNQIEAEIGEIRSTANDISAHTPGSGLHNPWLSGTNTNPFSLFDSPPDNAAILEYLRTNLPEPPKAGLWDLLQHDIDAKPIEPKKE